MVAEINVHFWNVEYCCRHVLNHLIHSFTFRPTTLAVEDKKVIIDKARKRNRLIMKCFKADASKQGI